MAIPIVVVVFTLVRLNRRRKEGAKANLAWEDFALQHCLRKMEPKPNVVTEINLDVLKDKLGPKRVTDLSPSKSFRGDIQGYPFELALVIKHGHKSSKMEIFTRMAIELPGIAKDLRVYPEKISSKIGKMLGSQDITTGDEEFDKSFMIKGSNPDDVNRYLTPDRRHILLSGSKDLGQLEIAAGQLYAVRKGQVGELSELSLLSSKMAAMAASLADA
jgi:hypothetical protein